MNYPKQKKHDSNAGTSIRHKNAPYIVLVFFLVLAATFITRYVQSNAENNSRSANKPAEVISSKAIKEHEQLMVSSVVKASENKPGSETKPEAQDKHFNNVEVKARLGLSLTANHKNMGEVILDSFE